jgi:formyl-CoA transferase
MSITGQPDGPPTKAGARSRYRLRAVRALRDSVASSAKNRHGQYIDALAVEAAIAFSIWDISEYWGTDACPPAWYRQPLQCALSAVREGCVLRDGGEQQPAAESGEVLERADLPPMAFQDIADRLLHRVVLIEELEKCSPTQCGGLIDIPFGRHPAGPSELREALASEQQRARSGDGIEHPVEGRVKSIGFPVKPSETKQRVRLALPGQHTEEIRRAWIDEAICEQLRAEGTRP